MRLLHTMLRVGDLEKSIKFYTEILEGRDVVSIQNKIASAA